MKVISIKSSIGKMKMKYREIPDTTVTTCDRALMFLVPAICAGNKVRNTIAISECGVGMVPAPFLQKLSDCGYQDIHNCPLLGESPHRTALANFLKILQKSGYHPARSCPLTGGGANKRRWHAWSGFSIKTTPGAGSVQESVQAA